MATGTVRRRDGVTYLGFDVEAVEPRPRPEWVDDSWDELTPGKAFEYAEELLSEAAEAFADAPSSRAARDALLRAALTYAWASAEDVNDFAASTVDD